jgi:hypothetical protein
MTFVDYNNMNWLSDEMGKMSNAIKNNKRQHWRASWGRYACEGAPVIVF